MSRTAKAFWRVVAFVPTHPVLVLLGVFGLTLASVLVLYDVVEGRPRLVIDPSMNRLMPDDDDDRRYYESIRQRFGSDDTIVIALDDDDLFTPTNLRTLGRITRRLEGIPGVDHVTSLATAVNVRGADGELQIAPFLEGPSDDPGWALAVKREALSNPVYAGNLVATDATATAVLVHLTNMSEREFVKRGIEAEIRKVLDEEDGDIESWITGAPIIKAATARTLLADLVLIVPLAMALTLFIAFLSFRSVRGVVIPLFTVVIGIVWTLAVMTLAGRPLNLVTTILPPLLLTVGYAEVMHLLSEYYDLAREDVARGQALGGDFVMRVLRKVAVPIVVCTITTMLGFATLAISPLSAIEEFGWFSTLGVFLIMLSTLLFAPAVLQLLPPPQNLARRERMSFLDPLFEALARFDIRHRNVVFGVYAVLLVVAVFGMSRIRVSTDLVGNFGVESDVRKDFDAVNERLEGAGQLYLVLESVIPEAFKEPEMLRTVHGIQGWLEKHPVVGGTTSFVDFLMLLNRGFHDNDPEFLSIPESRRLVSQLLMFASNDEVENLVDTNYQAATIVVRAKAIDSMQVAALVGSIEERLAELPAVVKGTVTGNIVLLSSTIDDLARGQFESVLSEFILIYLVLVLTFTSFRIGLVALIPNAFPVAAYFGLMGFTGVTLNATTGLVACIVLGIAVDDTTHFLHRFNDEARRLGNEEEAAVSTLRSLGRPVLRTSLALCLGFLVLTASRLQNQVEFGMLAAATLAIGWICEATLMPAICSVTRIVAIWDMLSVDLGPNACKEVPLFRGLTSRQARIATLMMTVVRFYKGERVMREHERSDDMFVVLDGELAASVATTGGAKHLAVMRRGDSVGEVGLFHGQRTADVDALTEVRAVRVRRSDLERLRWRYPWIAARVFWNLSEILGGRVANTTDKIREWPMRTRGAVAGKGDRG